jgi:hypothetical protein
MLEDRSLEISGKHPVLAEGPDRIEDPHDARDGQHDGREHYPPFTAPMHCVPFLGMPVFAL